MYGKTQFNIWYKLEGVCMCVLVGKSDVLSINNVYIHIQYNIKRERDSRKFGKLKLVYMESWVGCCVHHPLTDRQLYTISESEFFNRHRMTVTDTDTDIHLYGLRVTRLDDDDSPLRWCRLIFVVKVEWRQFSMPYYKGRCELLGKFNLSLGAKRNPNEFYFFFLL